MKKVLLAVGLAAVTAVAFVTFCPVYKNRCVKDCCPTPACKKGCCTDKVCPCPPMCKDGVCRPAVCVRGCEDCGKCVKPVCVCKPGDNCGSFACTVNGGTDTPVACPCVK